MFRAKYCSSHFLRSIASWRVISNQVSSRDPGLDMCVVCGVLTNFIHKKTLINEEEDPLLCCTHVSKPPPSPSPHLTQRGKSCLCPRSLWTTPTTKQHKYFNGSFFTETLQKMPQILWITLVDILRKYRGPRSSYLGLGC